MAYIFVVNVEWIITWITRKYIWRHFLFLWYIEYMIFCMNSCYIFGAKLDILLWSTGNDSNILHFTQYNIYLYSYEENEHYKSVSRCMFIEAILFDIWKGQYLFLVYTGSVVLWVWSYHVPREVSLGVLFILDYCMLSLFMGLKNHNSLYWPHVFF